MLSKHGQKLAQDMNLLPYPKEGFLCGRIGEFPVVIGELQDRRLVVRLWAKPGDTVPARELEEFLRMELPDLPKGFGSKKEEYGWAFLIPPMQYPKKLETIRSLFGALSRYFSENAMVPCCAHCGSTGPTGLYQCGEGAASFCESCAAECSQALQAPAAGRKSQPGNVLLGLVGPVIGAVPGVILWLLIYRLGYIAAVCGLLLAFGAVKGYSMLGKRLDVKGTVISVIVSVVMLVVALMLCYGWALYDVFGPEGFTFLDCILAVPTTLAVYPEILTTFVGEFIIGLLLTGVGSFASVKRLYQQANPSTVFRKLV